MTARGRRWDFGGALPFLWGAAIVGLVVATLPGRFRDAASVLAAGAWRPSATVFLVNLVDTARIVAAAAATVVPAWLAGWLIWPWLTQAGRRLRPAAALPLGLGAVGFLLYGLLLTGLWFPGVLWLIPAALMLALARRGLPRLAASVRAVPINDGAARAAASVLAFAGLWLLLPETHDDPWLYHLAAPERWLAAHGGAWRGVEPALHLPLLSELTFVWPLLAGSDAAARWVPALAVLSGAAGFLLVLPGGASGWGPLAALLTSPAAFLVAAKSDGTAAGLVLLAWASARTGGRGASAVFAGLALATKLTTALSLAWIPLALPWHMLLLRPARLAGWGLLALTVWAPWGVKSWLLTGDPVYFMLAGAFPSLIPGWDWRNADLYRRWRYPRPWSWTRPGAVVAEVALIAPLFAWLAPLALRRAGELRRIVGWATAGYALSVLLFYNQHMSRLALPGLLAAQLAAGAAFGAAARTPGLTAVAVTLALAGGAVRVATQVHATGWYANPATWLLGAETAATQRARGLTALDEAGGTLRRAPLRRALLMVGEQRTYRFPHPTVMAVANSGCETPYIWRLAAEARDEAELRRRLRQANIGRVLYNPIRAAMSGGVQRPFAWTPRMLTLWRGFVARWLDPEVVPPRVDSRHGGCYVWRVRSRPGPAAAVLPFLPGTESLLADARLASERGDLPGLLAAWDAVLVRAPNVAAYRTGRAYALRLSGRWEEAYRDYLPGIRAGLMLDEHFSGFGIAALQTGRPAEAAAAFDRARDAWPEWTDVMADYAARARFFLAVQKLDGDPAAAEAVLRDALARFHPVGPAQTRGLLHVALAAALTRQGRDAEAADALRAAAPDFPQVAGITPAALPSLLPVLSRELLAQTTR